MRTLATIQNEGNGMICTLKTLTDCPLSELAMIGFLFLVSIFLIFCTVWVYKDLNDERKDK
jgi:hypothetical protein